LPDEEKLKKIALFYGGRTRMDKKELMLHLELARTGILSISMVQKKMSRKAGTVRGKRERSKDDRSNRIRGEGSSKGRIQSTKT